MTQEEKINAEEAETREVAREKGRKAAMVSTKKIDTIFTPNNYNADDAKVMFHPVDFLIFNGMKKKKTPLIIWCYLTERFEMLLKRPCKKV